MRVSIPKWLVSSLAAVALSAAGALSSAPADAAFFHGGGFGGFHGGFGGFHGGFGGFHGGFGGWRGGGWGGGWRGVGWGGGCGWGGCGWGGFWPGLAAGALIGAAVTYPYYGYGYPYYGYGYPYYGYGYPYSGASYGYGYGSVSGGCWARRPVYNRFGRYLGRHLVNMC